MVSRKPICHATPLWCWTITAMSARAPSSPKRPFSPLRIALQRLARGGSIGGVLIMPSCCSSLKPSEFIRAMTPMPLKPAAVPLISRSSRSANLCPQALSRSACRTITVAGYGLTDEKNRKSLGKLNRADLAVVEPNGHSTILVWLSDPASNGMGGCHGDSGGPMLFQGALIAITSWTTGEGKRDCGALTQGALIAPQRDWIKKAIEP